MEELILIRPTNEYAKQISEYRQEFLDAGDSMDGCGPLRRFEDPEAYVKTCMEYENPTTVPAELVVATQFMLVRKSDNRLVGMLQVRHYFNDYLEKYAGHIGYSVRPSERKKGYAKEMLKMALPFCREIGLEKVLVACIDGNIGSEKTILANGGVYESTVFEPNSNRDLKRFWISLFERVYLKPMTYEMYHAFFQEYENDMDLYLDKNEYFTYCYDKAKVDKYIQKQIDLKRIPLAIMCGDEIVGELKLYNIESHKCATLGISMKNANYKDRGFGTQAEQLVIDYVFHELDIPVLYADSILTNTRSQHVLEKVGFQLIGQDEERKHYKIELYKG